MWQIKIFKTKQKMMAFIEKYGDKIQWDEIFVDNAYGIEYRKLRRIY